jgi:hypothetical protein
MEVTVRALLAPQIATPHGHIAGPAATPAKRIRTHAMPPTCLLLKPHGWAETMRKPLVLVPDVMVTGVSKRLEPDALRRRHSWLAA